MSKASLNIVSFPINHIQPNKDTIKEFVTVTIENQMFGIPVAIVQDVLRKQRITPVPLASQEIAGVMNLRGRIVTAIDVRKRLGLDDANSRTKSMYVVVEYKGEQYSLIVDSVGEVMALPAKNFENNPNNLSPQWQEVSLGVYRLDDKLMVVLDVAKLLTLAT